MELRCLGASGQLGYGMPEAVFREGLARQPHVVGADLGSSDPGPQTLGSGPDGRGAAPVRRDLELLLGGARDVGVPVLMGSAGIAGGTPHLEAVAALVRELAHEHRSRFRLALIDVEVDPVWVEEQLAGGRVHSVGGAPPLAPADVRASERIVAPMGVEPFMAALDAGADVVLAGRACDRAIFAAALLRSGAEPGATYHMAKVVMAKVVERASQCAEPGGRDAILGTVAGSAFCVESMAPERVCRPAGVAAHALYEEADPFRFHQRSGSVDTAASVYEAVGDRITRVSGTRWVPAAQPTLKLEGAAREGYRTCCFGGVRDPVLLGQLPQVAEQVATRVADVLGASIPPPTDRLRLQLYGYDAVLGAAERAAFQGHEAAVLSMSLPTTRRPPTRCARARGSHLLHASTRASWPPRATSPSVLAGRARRRAGVPVQRLPRRGGRRPRRAVRRGPQGGRRVSAPSSGKRLAELASVIRSKNTGPLSITLDLMFDTPELLDRVVRTGLLTADRIADLYRVDPAEVRVVVFPPANAVKVASPSRCSSGSARDTDVYGTQQHVPLLGLALPSEQQDVAGPGSS